MNKNETNRRNSTSSKKRTKKIKGRIIADPAKLPKNTKIVLIALMAILLVLCFINMGLVFTIITAIGMAIIIGIAKLLDKVSHNRKKRKIVNIILIILLGLGILMLILFSIFLIYVTIKAPEFDVKELDKKE